MKGHTNNPDGRPKGVPNKATGQLREAITGFIEGNFDEVVKDWRTLDAKDKLTFYRDLIQYVVPKMQNVSMQAEITHDLEGLNGEQIEELADKLIKLQANE